MEPGPVIEAIADRLAALERTVQVDAARPFANHEVVMRAEREANGAADMASVALNAMGYKTTAGILRAAGRDAMSRWPSWDSSDEARAGRRAILVDWIERLAGVETGVEV